MKRNARRIAPAGTSFRALGASLREQVSDVRQHFSDVLVAALVADRAGADEGGIMAAGFRLLSGQIAVRAVAELDEEGLFRVGTGFDAVCVVQEELKGVRREGHGADP